MKPYLALFRCGPDSPNLALIESLAAAEFDVALSWSGPVAPALPGAVFVHVVEGGKIARWPALARTLAAHAEQIAGYSHVWLPVDDVLFDAATVARLFMICEQLGLELGQPAFRPDSLAAHPLALRHSEFQLRFTNHVDSAAAVLSRSMLAKVLPTLADNALVPDLLWPRLSRLGRVAIIDAATVARPTAPVPHALPDEELVNLGGLLESGDAWCLSPQAGAVEVLLQALMKSWDGMNLGVRGLARYLARHLALADSAAAASIHDELERELAAAGMRFNCAVPPRRQAGAAPAAASDAAAERTLALCQADLCDLQARYEAVQGERAVQDELLQRLAEQLAGLTQEMSVPSAAARRVEAV